MFNPKLVADMRIIKDVLKTVRDTLYYYLPGIIFVMSLFFMSVNTLRQGLASVSVWINFLSSNIILIIVFIASLVYYFSLLVVVLRCLHKSLEYDDNHCVVGATGEPGAGKTSSALYFAVNAAKRRWIELQWKYWIYRSLVNTKKNDPDFRKKYIEIATTYYYFRHREKEIFPMLYTNIPINVNGRRTTILTVAHAYQLDRAASFCVLFWDEIGSALSVDDAGQGRPLSVSDFARLCRHFGQFKIFFTEQCKENIYKDWRRVVSYHDFNYEQKWSFKPRLLMAIYYVFATIIFTNIKHIGYNRYIAQLFYDLESYCLKIGFRKYRFEREGSTEHKQTTVKGKGTYYLPSRLNAKYNDRLFRDLYQAPQDLEERFWDNDYIDVNSKEGKYFTREKDAEIEFKDRKKKQIAANKKAELIRKKDKKLNVKKSA